MKYTHVQRSIMWSSLSLPLALVTGKAVEAVLKTINPSHVDVTAGLAYLAQIIYTSMIILLVCWLMSGVSLSLAQKSDEDRQQIRFATIVLSLVILFTVLMITFNAITNRKIERLRMSTQASQNL